MNKYTEKSKYLSLVLRHKPEVANIILDSGGWANVGSILKALEIDQYELENKIVLADKKQRYSFNPDKTLIRANQGHSIQVDLGLIPEAPPMVLYHGTAERFISSIKDKGILKGERNHVHLSETEQTATQVGSRHGNKSY